MFINKVTIYSHIVHKMKDFYVNNLGFHLLKSDDHHFQIEIGKSILEIKECVEPEKPYYHFAFNIPANTFKGAKEWVKHRVTLNTEEDDDEVHFSFSKANALYFYDPSGNIVEFISRYGTSPDSNNPFSVKSILNISEMCLTVNDVVSVGESLIDFGVPVMHGEALSDDQLNFMGEYKDGSFLLLGPQKRRWLFSDKESKFFPATILIDNSKEIKVDGNGSITLAHI